MRTRKTRLAVIVDILTHNSISCQDELSKHLALRGLVVTQATLSRDLKKLRTTKVANDLGGYRYVIPTAQDNFHRSPEYADAPIQSAMHPAVESLKVSGNMLIIKTRNGYASGLAYDIDSLRSPLLLGSIPGADTVLVVTHENASRKEIFDLLRNFLPTEVLENARAEFLDGSEKDEVQKDMPMRMEA